MANRDAGVGPVPADQGLSTLGMLMQLAGSLWAAIMVLGAIETLAVSEWAHVDTTDVFISLLVLLSLATRSLLHRHAGQQLLYGTGARLAGIWRYIGFSLVHTVCLGVLLKLKFHYQLKPVAATCGALALWPIALLVIFLLPRFRRFHADLPLSEDKGFEGAAIVMTLLGVCGVIAVGTTLVVLFEVPESEITRGSNVLVLMSLIVLLVRSGLHAHAGIDGLRSTSVDRGVELANRYANFGVISSFCGAGALLMFVMSTGVDLMAFAFVACVVWVLLAWPLIVRKYFSDRQFAELLAGDQAQVHHRAPDAGLTSLGWLLVGFAAVSASQLVLGSGNRFQIDSFTERLFTVGSPVGDKTAWWSVGVAVLQAWAGFELIHMRSHSRILASVYGVVGTAVTLYLSWPLFSAIKHVDANFKAQQVVGLELGIVALQLLVPLATLLLVNRAITPTARARFRSRSQQPAAS